MAKSSVSTLQEYCAQKKLQAPEYHYIEEPDGGFSCRVEILDMEAYGNGRSKRDAKHLSAHNILKKLKANSEVIIETQTSCLSSTSSITDKTAGAGDAEFVNINRDMLKELRDLCVKRDMPLPTIEIVQQTGQPDAPEFVALCQIASIKRYATSDKKKDARQKAAIEMLRVVSEDPSDEREHLMQLAPLTVTNTMPTLDELEAERRLKFKTYRDLTESGSNEIYGTRLCDRHNYFKTFHKQLKKEALDIINARDEYEIPKDQAYAVLHALKLEARTTVMEATSTEPMLFIELNSEYDCVFLGLESQVYRDIIQYFAEMLI